MPSPDVAVACTAAIAASWSAATLKPISPSGSAMCATEFQMNITMPPMMPAISIRMDRLPDARPLAARQECAGLHWDANRVAGQLEAGVEPVAGPRNQKASNSAASKAHPAPKANATNGDTDCHSQPNSNDAGSKVMPNVMWYQPNAVPSCSLGTRSATSAFPAPSVAAMNIPNAANNTQMPHAGKPPHPSNR